MIFRPKSQEEIDAENRGLLALILVVSLLAALVLYLIKEENKKEPDYKLRQYQAEINQIEYENKIKADTEAARLKLKQLHEQRLKELEKDNG